MKLLVLAGGLGTRLRHAVSDVPKSLAPIGDSNFLRIQLENWIDQGVRSFIFLLQYKSEQIISYLMEEQKNLLGNCKVQLIVEKEPLGTGGAIANALYQLKVDGDFLVTNADTWLHGGIRELIKSTSPAMLAIKVKSTGRYGAISFDEKNYITEFTEKAATQEGGWINGGMCKLNSTLFEGWDGIAFSLEDRLFPRLASQGLLKAVPLKTDFIDIGIPKDYFRFCEWIKLGKRGVLNLE